MKKNWKSEKIRLECGVWTEKEKQDYRDYLLKKEQKRRKELTKGIPLFSEEENGKA